ncbi:MAG: adenosylcobinamide-phosphate synthase CbiB [Alphaproteobacteria bacterium]
MILAAALVLDGALPERRWPLPWPGHPVRFLGAVIAHLDHMLNRPERGRMRNIAWGGVAALIVVAGAVLSGLVLHVLANSIPFGWVVELAAVVTLLAQRSLFAHVRRVERPLAQGDLENARHAVSHIVGRDPRSLDRHGVARAAVESLVENFSDGVIAPALFYALFGLPGLFAYKAVNTLDSMLGHRSPRHLYFGRVSARLDDAMNFVPARISVALLAAAAFLVPGARPSRAVAIAWRDAGKHRSVNAGWPEAAAAGALDLALAGPRRYGTETVDDPWLGDGAPDMEARDIARALRLYVAACALFTLAVAFAWLGFD